jgi:hypothetical protein
MTAMSYARGLGQAKIVPGQISFQTLPEGRSGFPSLDPLIQAGLPIAPYIEHGSWTTGQPDIMRYGRDPYRGIMGLGAVPRRGRRCARCGGTHVRRNGLGQLLTSTMCDPTSVSTAFQTRLTGALNAGSQADTMAALGKGPLTQDDVVSELVKRGMPEHAALGFAMNGKDESGLDPTAVGDNGNAFGLFQWNGPRKKALFDFAAGQGKDPADPQVQYDYLMTELQGPESAAWAKIAGTNDPNAAW